jgi:hypothetical protein
MPPLLLALIVLAAVASTAQDAVKTLPDNYRVEYENDYVRVTRVHYPPHAKLPGHTHTSLPSAYVYLNDAGPVSFKHIGLDYGAVTRPATIARSFRLYRGLEEIHEVENLSAAPSHFLRVEFKTDPGPDPRSLRGKFLPPAPGSDVVQKLEFENAQLRVTRFLVPAGSSIPVSGAQPSLFITLTGEPGAATWLPAGHRLAVGDTRQATEMLRFELRTAVRTSH